MKKLFWILVFGCFAATHAKANDEMHTIMEGKKGVCLEQAKQILLQKFRVPFSVENYKIYPSGGGRHPMRSDLWMWTSLCSGEIVFHLSVPPDTCKSIHYGDTPNYVYGVYGTGSCKKLFK